MTEMPPFPQIFNFLRSLSLKKQPNSPSREMPLSLPDDAEPLRPSGHEWSTLPEVNYTQQEGTNLPETVPVSDLPEAIFTSDKPYQRSTYYSHQAELASTLSSDETPPPRVGWLRRGRNKVILGVSIAVVLAIVSVVVGVVVSQRKGGDNQSSGSKSKEDHPTSTTAIFGTPTSFPALQSNTPPPLSTCSGTVCPQMLASARLNDTNTLLFARGSNGEIWYREIVLGGNNSSSPSWRTDKWKSLGGGKFTSQPKVVSPREGRVDVFAVSVEYESTRYKTFHNGVWETEWTSLGGVAKSPPVVCSHGRDNMIVVVVGGDWGVWRKSTEDGGNYWGPDGPREGLWGSDGGSVAGSLGTVCIESTDSDEGVGSGGVGYFAEAGCGPGPDRLLGFRMWNSTDGWYSNTTQWSSDGQVSCRGNPTLVSLPGKETIAYFAVGTDMAIWLLKTSAESGVAAGAVSLGGRFQSVVDVMVTGTSRLDVFAVGTDTRLKHMAYVEGQGWGQEWEDLGGYFNSAPKVVRLNDTAVVVFGIGQNGNVIHSIFDTVSGGATWGLQEWYSDGGEMSSLSY